MKRPRLKKWAKPACTFAAASCLSLALFSRFYSCDYATTSNSGRTFWFMGVDGGLLSAVKVDHLGPANDSVGGGWDMGRAGSWRWGTVAEVSPSGSRWDWYAGLHFTMDPHGWTAGISLFYPILLTTIPAALLWYADRRRYGPGRCAKCGYDRAGLTANANCPECGAAPPK